MNQASHYIDILTWLFGPLDKVNAFTSTKRKIEAEDSAVLNLKWRSGMIGSLAVTMLTYPKNLEGSMTILGDNGTSKIRRSCFK
jgi:UDP-N-acetyl-2-amino-2-deoxyglucuronate dehydrogenase